MANIFSENILWSIGSIIILFGILAAHRLASYRDKKNRADNAADKFRNTIYTNLKGIYPKTASYLPIEEKDRITQKSINPINSAGDEFNHCILSSSRGSFIKALEDYCESARNTYWDKDMVFERFRESMATPDELSPGEKFSKRVEHLLSFATKKKLGVSNENLDQHIKNFRLHMANYRNPFNFRRFIWHLAKRWVFSCAKDFESV